MSQLMNICTNISHTCINLTTYDICTLVTCKKNENCFIAKIEKMLYMIIILFVL